MVKSGKYVIIMVNMLICIITMLILRKKKML